MAKKETEKEEKKAAKKSAEKDVKDSKKAPKKAEKEEKKATKKPAKDGKKPAKGDKSDAAKKKKKKKKLPDLPENALPQNIIAVGERVEEDKNIYIAQDVYKQIHKFTKNKLTNEAGGMLIGHTIEEFGKTNILITGFIEAKHSEGTPTTLTFTHETWDYVHSEIDKKYPGKKILGWIHTHPDFGIFLSDYDKFIHENFFNDENQIAYVVDPIQKIEGLYFWINGKLTKCTGFYIYDRTGEKIEMTPVEEPEEEKEAGKEKVFSFKNVLIVLLSIAVVFLIFSQISLNSEINKLKTNINTLTESQQILVDSANSALGNMQMIIAELEEKLTELDNQINPPEETTPESTDPTGETTTETTPETTPETTS